MKKLVLAALLAGFAVHGGPPAQAGEDCTPKPRCCPTNPRCWPTEIIGVDICAIVPEGECDSIEIEGVVAAG